MAQTMQRLPKGFGFMRRRAPKLSKVQKTHEGKALCPDHVAYFEMPVGSFDPAARTEDLGPDEPIECEVCSMAAMRKLGVI